MLGQKTTDDLVKIVSYAPGSTPVVILRNANSKTTDDLVKIASYGKGRSFLSCDFKYAVEQIGRERRE